MLSDLLSVQICLDYLSQLPILVCSWSPLNEDTHVFIAFSVFLSVVVDVPFAQCFDATN